MEVGASTSTLIKEDISELSFNSEENKCVMPRHNSQTISGVKLKTENYICFFNQSD